MSGYRSWALTLAPLVLAAACTDRMPTELTDRPAPAPLSYQTAGAPPDVRPVPAGFELPIEFAAPRRPATSGDFGIGSGAALAVAAAPSLVWYATDGTATIWKMNGPTGPVSGEGGPILTIPSPWKLVASGDLNGDGHPDLIWEEYTMGTRAVTFMNGPAYAGSYAMMFQFSSDWKILAVIDFNFDNKPDLVVNNTATGQNGVLFMNGSSWSGSFNYLPAWAPPYKPVAIADMNGDAKPDMLLYDPATGVFFTGVLNGINWVQSVYGDTQAGYQIGALADFDFDDDNDIVWQNLSNGSRKIVFMNGTGAAGQFADLPSVSVDNKVVSAPMIRYNVQPLNLTLVNWYATQGIQDLSRSVPLIAGRATTVRAFVVASDYNDAAPSVRVRITQSGGSFTDFNVTRSADPGVPTLFLEGSAGATYNATIPGNLITAGASISVMVDPTNAIAESNESDNLSTGPLSVRTVAPFSARFVPVHLANGGLGNVTVDLIPNYMKMTMKIWPFSSYDADLHATFNSAAVEMSKDTSWYRVNLEILNLRTAEGSSRYYYGVMPNQSPSYAAGVGYVGLPAAIGLSATSASDTSISEVNAHEWGHNFNRPHAPGCGAGGPDPAYPVATGNLDAYGYNVANNIVYPPQGYFDIMSYCGPKWVAGWSFKQVLNYVSPFSSPGSSAVTPSLLVSGRVKSDGSIELEPAFEVNTQAVTPRGSAYLIEGVSSAGDVLFSYPFDGAEIADASGSERHFSFAIPLSSVNKASMAQLRVLNRTTRAVLAARGRKATGAEAADTRPALDVVPEGVRLRWNAASFPGVMVRDAETGEIIAFARGGDMRILAKANRALDLTFSDGVRSVVTRAVAH